MSDQNTKTERRPVRTPPLTSSQKADLEAKKEEGNESTGIEGVRQALTDAHDSIGEALDKLDEIEAEAK